MFVFLATELTEVGQKLEGDELLTIQRLSFTEIFEKIKGNEIEDAKSMVGLLLAGTKLGYHLS
jgi:ADP-ribose pyrophosphatase